MIAVWMSSGSLPLPLRVGGGETRVGALAGDPLGNHHEGTSPLSVTCDGPFPAGWPMTSMLPQIGHRVRLPACWSSALNFLPQEHNTEIIGTTPGGIAGRSPPALETGEGETGICPLPTPSC